MQLLPLRQGRLEAGGASRRDRPRPFRSLGLRHSGLLFLDGHELTKQEALRGLDKAQSLGVQGARVYDYWHALVSHKAKSDQLLTRHTRDFQGLAQNVARP